MKQIAWLLMISLLLGLAMPLTGCQLSQLGKDKETTAADTTTGTEETPEDPYPPMDLMATDLSEYITLAPYKQVEIEGVSNEYTDAEFEAALQEFLEYYADYSQITDRPTAKGDILNIDFEGFMDGKAFEGGTAQGQHITLSENTGYIAGFDKDLYGIMPGTTVESDMVFPEDYHEDLAGKAVTFKITVNYILGSELIMPELTDAFIEEASEGEFKTVDAFLTEFRTMRAESKRQQADAENANAVFAKVLADSTIHKCPEQQINYYYMNNVSYYTAMAQNYGTTYEEYLATFNMTDTQLRADAETYVKEDLVFYSIIKAEGIAVNDEEYKAGRDRYAAMYEDVFYYYGYDAQYKDVYEWLDTYYGEESLRQSLLWDEVFASLLSWATVRVSE